MLPQNSLLAINQQGSLRTLKVDAQGSLLINSDGTTTIFNISVPTLVKTSPGRIVKIATQIAGSDFGTLNDCVALSDANDTNVIFKFGNMLFGNSIQIVNWECAKGIVVIPGTGQTIAISYI